MDIAGTISKYRKAKNLSQEALGELVGVTNQAVSKWENGTSSPDISIIPALAEALGISLEQFFGVRDDSQPERVSADDLPEEAFKRLYHTFSELWKLSPLAEAKETWLKAWRLSCVSNTHGCMTAAAGPFAFIDLSFKTPNGGEIFENDYTARAVSKLFQKSVRKVLEYEYNFTVARNDYTSGDTGHTAAEICETTGLSEDEVLDALDTLVALEINSSDGGGVYYIEFGHFPDLFALFQSAKLATGSHYWHRLRDTTVITDRSLSEDI